MRGISNRTILLGILRSVVFIACLSSFLVVYLPDIIDKYHTKDTTFALKKVPNDNPTIPAITLCSLKPYKLEIIKKLTGSYDRAAFINSVTFLTNISVPAVFREASFTMNQDYTVYMNYSKLRKLQYNNVLGLGKNEIGGSIIYVDEVPSWMKGMCYSLTFEKIWTQALRLAILPNTTVDNDNSPSEGMVFHVSMKNTASNIAVSVWEAERSTSVRPVVIAKKFAYR